MRVSPVGWAFHDLDTVLEQASRTAEVTHNHPEGIKGAQAVAGAVYLARSGKKRAELRAFVEERFGYDCSSTLDELRAHSSLDVTCQGTLPAATTLPVPT